MARSTIPGLKMFTNLLLRYVARNRERLRSRLTEGQNALLDVLVEAAQSLADAITDEIVN